MTSSTHVLVLRANGGHYLDLHVEAEAEEGETLANAVLRELSQRAVPPFDGDVLYFPNAAPGHRYAMVVHGQAVKARVSYE